MIPPTTRQVLSVDDDKVNQLVASTALKIHNWEVVKCMSGAEVGAAGLVISQAGRVPS
jgi:CheY-like chemotaxis protein